MKKTKPIEAPKFVLCSCWMDALAIWKDSEMDLWEISMWRTGRMAFFNRFRCAWRCLLHGTPYLDQVCLDRRGYKQLINILSKYPPTFQDNGKRNKK